MTELNQALQIIGLIPALVLLWISLRFAAKACATANDEKSPARELTQRPLLAALLHNQENIQQDRLSGSYEPALGPVGGRG
jgi:threonine/homoserine/homoserine lactone efflux protein